MHCVAVVRGRETPTLAGVPMTVVEIRRYPVKAMGGESLTSCDLDLRGLDGDRWFAVVDADGRFAAGKDSRRFRRRDAVFSYAAARDGERVVVRRGASVWDAPSEDLDAELTEAMQAPVRVLPEGDVPHFDAAGVSLVGTATLAWCADAWGVDTDRRRLRPNLVVETDEPFVEETWAGVSVSVGTARLRWSERTERCRTVDLDQDGVGATTHLLKATAARDLCLGVYLEVDTPGRIAVGDAVTVS